MIMYWFLVLLPVVMALKFAVIYALKLDMKIIKSCI